MQDHPSGPTAGVSEPREHLIGPAQGLCPPLTKGWGIVMDSSSKTAYKWGAVVPLGDSQGVVHKGPISLQGRVPLKLQAKPTQELGEVFAEGAPMGDGGPETKP